MYRITVEQVGLDDDQENKREYTMSHDALSLLLSAARHGIDHDLGPYDEASPTSARIAVLHLQGAL